MEHVKTLIEKHSYILLKISLEFLVNLYAKPKKTGQSSYHYLCNSLNKEFSSLETAVLRQQVKRPSCHTLLLQKRSYKN